MRAAVIGAGTVGRATTLVLQRGEWACFYWDVRAELSTGIWEQVVAADAVVFCLSGMRSVKEDSASVVDLVAKLEADGYRGGYVQRTTCLPGTAQGVIDALQLGDRYVVWPEFLREATWERDALAPHRVVYGCDAGTASRGIHGRLATCVARAMTGLRPTTLIVTPTEAEVGKLG